MPARPAGVASCSRNHAAATSCTLSSASRSRWRFGVLLRVLRLRARSARRAPRAAGPPPGSVTLSYSSTNLMTSPPTPQPKQWKNPLLAVDVERRRLLAVERAEPLPRRARLVAAARAPARSARCRRATSGRRRRTAGKRHGTHSFSSTTVTPPPPWFVGAPASKLATNGCVCEELGDRAPQLPGAVAVDEADAPQLADQRLVEELLGPRQRLVDRAADHVQFASASRRAAPGRR